MPIEELTSDDWNEVASMFAGTGKLKQSKACFTQSIATDSGNANAYAGLASVNITEKDYGIAEGNLNKAIETDPRCATAWFNLGNLKHRQRKFTNARQCFFICMTCENPFMELVYSALAMNSQYLGDYRQAIEEYKTALQHNANSQPLRMFLGLTQMLLGEWKEGLKNYESRLAVCKVPWPTQGIEIWNRNPRRLP